MLPYRSDPGFSYHAQHDRYAIRETSFLWGKKKQIAIISYYDWESDARIKASTDIYLKLGYETHILNTATKKSQDATTDNRYHTSYLIKYQGDSLFLHLFYHFLFFLYASGWLLKKCITCKNLRLIHIHNMPDYFVFVGWVGRFFRKKILWDVRDITPAVWFSKKSPNELEPHGFLYKTMLFVFKGATRVPHYILCADEFQKRYILENGTKKKPVYVFMNLPLGAFKWTGPAQGNDTFRLVYHGTLAHRLGLDLAIKAVSDLRSELDDIRFDIVGDGDFKDNLIDQINELDANDFIHITPTYIPVEAIPDWVKGASGAIIPNRKTYSTNYYMLPHKMLEDIKMGIPVILPRLENIQWYIKDDMAIFYEPENVEDLKKAIKKLYHTDRDTLAKKAFTLFDNKFDNKFNNNLYENNENIIKSIVAESFAA